MRDSDDTEVFSGSELKFMNDMLYIPSKLIAHSMTVRIINYLSFIFTIVIVFGCVCVCVL